jgi:hypothetical protein
MSEVAPALPVASPCVRVCRLAPGRRLCEGCGRTPREIAAWGTADDEERRLIRERAAARLRAWAASA